MVKIIVAVLTYTDNSQKGLAIIEGDTASTEVSLGDVDIIRSTPVIVDVMEIQNEIAIVYDSMVHLR